MENSLLPITHYDTLKEYPFMQRTSIYDSARIVHQEPDAAELREIDPDAIEFKVVFGETKEVSVPPEKYNDVIDENLRKLKEEGYILLDLAVCNALLENTDRIPKAWWSQLDSDGPMIMNVSFYGTQLAREDGVPFTLAPFLAHGHWTCGWEPLHFSAENIALYGTQEVAGIHRHAAVYRPMQG